MKFGWNVWWKGGFEGKRGNVLMRKRGVGDVFEESSMSMWMMGGYGG